MKQTAVEWLIEHLNLDETSPNYNKLIIDQALEIEKEQIIAAYWASYKEGQYSGDKTADEYYNENFKQEIEKL
jgi:putative NIF3 family GTP cyclohydrolase 1 type 2